jgi:hypothetical protein
MPTPRLTSLIHVPTWLAYFCLLAIAPAAVPRVHAQDLTPHCGGHNEPACREHDRAQFWSYYGCPPDTFRDPRNGGECWSCPSGYSRTVRQVTSPKACAVRTRGPFRAATYRGKPRECPTGTFRDIGRNECWSCDEGYRRTVAPVTSEQACLIEPGHVCDPDTRLKVTEDKCYSPAPEGMAEAAARAKSEHASEIARAEQLADELGSDAAFRRALREDDQDAVLARLHGSPNYQALVSSSRPGSAKEPVLALGLGADASLFVGGNAEVGMVIGASSECSSPVRGYITGGYSAGLSAGADGSFAVSILSVGTIENVAGDSQGFAVGLASVPGVGAAVTIWFSYGYDTSGKRPIGAPILGEYIGFTLAIQVGESVEVGEYNRIRTRLFRPKRCD